MDLQNRYPMFPDDGDAPPGVEDDVELPHLLHDFEKPEEVSPLKDENEKEMEATKEDDDNENNADELEEGEMVEKDVPVVTESIEDKPWKNPGADLSDYFNFGFDEDTWKAYYGRQKYLRTFAVYGRDDMRIIRPNETMEIPKIPQPGSEFGKTRGPPHPQPIDHGLQLPPIIRAPEMSTMIRPPLETFQGVRIKQERFDIQDVNTENYELQRGEFQDFPMMTGRDVPTSEGYNNVVIDLTPNTN